MQLSTPGRAAMVAAVMTLQLTGCADSGPTAVITPAPSKLVALDVGTGQLRLDIARRELRYPDGRVVDLKVDETEWIATEFAAQAALANAVSYTVTDYTDPDDECDWHMEYCEEATLRAQPASASTTRASITPSYLQAPGGNPAASARKDRGDFERTYGKIRVRISKDRPGAALRSPRPVVVEFQQGWSCADVRGAMLAARAEAEARRLSVRDLFNTVIGWVSFTIIDGQLRGTFGPGARGAVADAVESMETNRVNIALMILQKLYDQMGCGNVTGGTLPDENLPAGWEKRCTDVWGTIFLPWGQVYTGWFKECEVVQAK
jgi:hypothetical protein